MDYLLRTKNLSKTYDNFKLENIHLDVPKGSIVGLVGENGAGKTTTIKLILNLVKKDGGEAEIFGLDHIKNEVEIKSHIGVVFDEPCFFDTFSAKDIGAILKPAYSKWDDALFHRYIEKFSLPFLKPIKEYSRGMKMKLQIAAALSHNPKLLLLDEPTSGLDPMIRNEILDVFLEFIQDEEKGILLSSHITSDLEKIADYICFIHQGKQILFEEKDTLLEKYGLVKCSLNELKMINKEDVLGVKENQFGAEMLVADKYAAIKKYPFLIEDRITIDEIMMLIAKGDHQ